MKRLAIASLLLALSSFAHGYGLPYAAGPGEQLERAGAGWRLQLDRPVQPLVVRARPENEGGGFVLIAGERRWRAARMAGLEEVQVVVQDLADEKLLEISLIENIQREDLNPIEEAQAYRRLADEFHLTQEAIASAVGKDRASVANYVRLLKLPEELKHEVAAGRLSMGHARALLGLPSEAEQIRLGRDAIARTLSVRETESLVKRATDERESPEHTLSKKPADVHTRAAEDRLRVLFGTRVRIVRRGAAGRVEIAFGSEEELIRIFDQLTGDS